MRRPEPAIESTCESTDSLALNPGPVTARSKQTAPAGAQSDSRGVIVHNSANKLGRELFDRYNEPARHYHTIEHIDACLELFDQVSVQCENPDAVELSIWFHDAIYFFPVEDNEQQSADYFMHSSNGVLADDLRQLVYEHILVTDHQSMPVGPDQEFLIDIDLSSFGRPWEKFLSDGVNVRREMDYVADDDFYANQFAFMQKLLDRETFYFTRWFQENFEHTARENIQRYLERLSAKGYAR